MVEDLFASLFTDLCRTRRPFDFVPVEEVVVACRPGSGRSVGSGLGGEVVGGPCGPLGRSYCRDGCRSLVPA